VTGRPTGSSAVVKNSTGKVVSSEGTFEYRYQVDALPAFTPDQDGHYEITVQANLLFPDDQFAGGPTTASYTFAVDVQGGSSAGGCSDIRGSESAGPLILLGLALLAVRHRRSRRVRAARDLAL
jgi:hypothetical protein